MSMNDLVIIVVVFSGYRAKINQVGFRDSSYIIKDC